MKTNYEVAMEESAKAIKAFRLAQSMFRSGQISDSEFLAAKGEYDSEMAKYDAAFAEAQNG